MLTILFLLYFEGKYLRVLHKKPRHSNSLPRGFSGNSHINFMQQSEHPPEDGAHQFENPYHHVADNKLG
ncbi:hypothetical protein [Paucimonas lemoignei]|uniref:hypothetical protein n=1 Tax=Paucimonas lemoignei TaxID=29443 RepID=UPI001051CEC8|nr:hypothetical protein [Paucimonas lemoignei]